MKIYNKKGDEKMEKVVKETLSEIKVKIDILSEIVTEQKDKFLVKNIMAMDILQTLILAEYKLNDEKVADDEKVDLCEMMFLLFMQVKKIGEMK